MRTFVVLCLLISPSAFGGVGVGDKHLLIIKPGLDALWGNYIFAIKNDGESPESFSTTIMLPKEVVDYRPQEGVEAADMRLSDDGVALEKVFPPGLHIISIEFRTDVTLGRGILTLTPSDDIPDFNLLLPAEEVLDFEAGPLIPAEKTPDPRYRAWHGDGTFVKGKQVVLTVRGVPEGRLRFWIIGSAVGCLLLLVAGFLALRSRPKIDETKASMLVFTEKRNT